MKSEQVDRALQQKFYEDDERIVFWHDSNSEFTEYIAQWSSSELKDVQVIELAKKSGLATKLLLEEEGNQNKYLIYTTGNPTPVGEDWLFDIRCYSTPFCADMASVWCQELGLKSLSLNDHLKERTNFLRNQNRKQKLKSTLLPEDTAEDIDTKMIAVLAGSDIVSTPQILQSIFHNHCDGGIFNLDQTPKVMEQICKMNLAEHFWELITKEFVYTSEKPSISALIRHMFVSDLLHNIDGASINALSNFELSGCGKQNATVCLTHWRDSAEKSSSYAAVAEALSQELQISDRLDKISPESLLRVFTFWDAESKLIGWLKNRVLEESHAINVESIKEIVKIRKNGFWLGSVMRNDSERKDIAHAYDAIVAAAELFELRTKHLSTSLNYKNPDELLSAYQKVLYKFDQLYRCFIFNSRPLQTKLKSLIDEIEKVYETSFLQTIGLEWGRLLDEGFIDEWKLSDFPSEQNFFEDTIRPYLDKSDRKRAYVIISDAFRYEAAEETVRLLNGKYRIKAELQGMLGVLPSYTTLGMASLLPHKSLSYDNNGNVLVDGKSTSGIQARDKILNQVEGMACKASDLLKMRSEEARNFAKDKKVVYIYHDVIDACGDNQSTETETFKAVDECINEVVKLVKLCVDKLNATNVWVTADHGFLYQEKSFGVTDRSDLPGMQDAAIKSKKRYVIGRELGQIDKAHCGNTKITAGTSDSMEFWLPRGSNRFHFAGGAKFVHGGAMPQEIIVPLITVKHVRGKNQEKTRTEKVQVQVLGNNHKITTPTHRFELIQTEPVSDRRKPIKLRISVCEEGHDVTSIETRTFDSTSQNFEERKQTIRLELNSGNYDKTTNYYLVLRDVETEAEIQSIPITIDRSFDDDFA
jgi:uncharacterized protein (TIGR02687 family)